MKQYARCALLALSASVFLIFVFGWSSQPCLRQELRRLSSAGSQIDESSLSCGSFIQHQFVKKDAKLDAGYGGGDGYGSAGYGGGAYGFSGYGGGDGNDSDTTTTRQPTIPGYGGGGYGSVTTTTTTTTTTPSWCRRDNIMSDIYNMKGSNPWRGTLQECVDKCTANVQSRYNKCVSFSWPEGAPATSTQYCYFKKTWDAAASFAYEGWGTIIVDAASCCTPKTASDFPSAWECGSLDDGCGGLVQFSRAGSTLNNGCGTGHFWSCDGDHKCHNTGPQVQLECSFEEPPVRNRFCDFLDNEKGPGGGIFWTQTSGKTPSAGTGATSAKGSNYIFTEASNNFNKKALLKSIPFNVSAKGSLSFMYHMYGSDMGTLTLQVLRDGVSTDIWSKSGDQGNSWCETSKIDLLSYANTTIQLVFEGHTGSGYRSDISIDDVAIY